jgi:hypothetical protein
MCAPAVFTAKWQAEPLILTDDKVYTYSGNPIHKIWGAGHLFCFTGFFFGFSGGVLSRITNNEIIHECEAG